MLLVFSSFCRNVFICVNVSFSLIICMCYSLFICVYICVAMCIHCYISIWIWNWPAHFLCINFFLKVCLYMYLCFFVYLSEHITLCTSICILLVFVCAYTDLYLIYCVCFCLFCAWLGLCPPFVIICEYKFICVSA